MTGTDGGTWPPAPVCGVLGTRMAGIASCCTAMLVGHAGRRVRRAGVLEPFVFPPTGACGVVCHVAIQRCPFHRLLRKQRRRNTHEQCHIHLHPPPLFIVTGAAAPPVANDAPVVPAAARHAGKSADKPPALHAGRLAKFADGHPRCPSTPSTTCPPPSADTASVHRPLSLVPLIQTLPPCHPHESRQPSRLCLGRPLGP